MNPITLTPVPGLSFKSEEYGKPCHKHILNGEQIPGCTSVSGQFSEDGWKFAWPVKLMESHILEDLNRMAEKHDGYENGGPFVWLKDAVAITATHKNAWRRTRDSAASKGKDAHAFIEEYIKTGAIAKPPDDKEVVNCLDGFFKWEAKYNVEWLASEIQVGSLKYRFAGILDALVRVDDKIVLLDYKSSASIKDEYNIQLAGLCICLEEMGVTVDARAILHIPKEGEYEFRIIDSDLAKDKLAFLVGLEFYRHKNLFLARCKNRKKEKFNPGVAETETGGVLSTPGTL